MTQIAHQVTGSGPPLLLLHGFPQSQAMWARIAPQLAKRFTVVTADLRGYGDSFKPDSMAEMSFRLMAADMVALMGQLGFARFHVVGHDRGGRTGHRMALDAPEALLSLSLLDIVPTQYLLTHFGHAVARAYYHWTFLAQPEPVPEALIGHDPDRYFQDILTGLGNSAQDFDATALAQYKRHWNDPETVRCMCNDYRAALDVDLAHDTSDLGRRIEVPALVLFGGAGIMAQFFDVAASWEPWLTHMDSATIPGGHFFPDTHPNETAQALLKFLRAADRS